MTAVLDSAVWEIEGPLPQRGIGIVAPFDLALDRELYRWTPDDISLHVTRTHLLEMPVNPEMCYAVSDAQAVRQATRDLTAIEPAAVAYACTSGSFIRGVAGELALCTAMLAGGAPLALTASGALLEALGTLGIDRVAVAAPYTGDVTSALCDFLTEAGYETTGVATLGLNSSIWKVPYQQVAELIRAADGPDADAIVVSCTNLPTYDLIAPLEDLLDKPIISANQATMWAAMHLIGAEPVGPGQRLLTAGGFAGRIVDNQQSTW